MAGAWTCVLCRAGRCAGHGKAAGRQLTAGGSSRVSSMAQRGGAAGVLAAVAGPATGAGPPTTRPAGSGCACVTGGARGCWAGQADGWGARTRIPLVLLSWHSTEARPPAPSLGWCAWQARAAAQQAMGAPGSAPPRSAGTGDALQANPARVTQQSQSQQAAPAGVRRRPCPALLMRRCWPPGRGCRAAAHRWASRPAQPPRPPPAPGGATYLAAASTDHSRSSCDCTPG